MKAPVFTTRFRREFARVRARGKDGAKFEAVAARLLEGKSLDPRQRDHPLKGGWVGWRDCHIEPDWVLIYKVTATEVIFARTGTHSDLF